MTLGPDHGVPVLATPLVQPDRRSCGAAVLVVARMWRDAAFAAGVLEQGRFADEVLTAHRRVTRLLAPDHGMQLPWPRALGTPPWAVARDLQASTGSGWRTVVVVPWARRRAWNHVLAAVRVGRQVPVYVGNRWLPRHVVLLVAAGVEEAGAYDPAVGRLVTVRADDFVASRLRLGRWSTPWFVVLPADGPR